MEKFNVVAEDQQEETTLNFKEGFSLYHLSYQGVIFGLVAINDTHSDNLKEIQAQVTGIKKHVHPFHDGVGITKVTNQYGYTWLGKAIANYVGQAPIQVHVYDIPKHGIGMIMACPKKALRKGFVNDVVWRNPSDLEGLKFGELIFPILEAGGFVSVEKV